MTDDGPVQVRAGHVLPALRPSAPTIAPFGAGIFTVIGNWSERRQIESHQMLMAAKNELVRLYNEQCDLLTARGVALERLNNIELIREDERISIQRAVARNRMGAEMDALEASVRIEDLKAQLAEAKQRRQKAENPDQPAPRPQPKSEAERFSEGIASINEIDAVMRAQRGAFVGSKGGEDGLSPDDRDILDKLDALRAAHLEKLYSELMK